MKKGKLITIVALALVLILAVGALGWISNGFKNWDYKSWFSGEDETEEIQAVANAEPFTLGEYVSRGIRLQSVSAVSTDSGTQTLTATIAPSNATDKSVTWSVAWNNASSTWASGKSVTNYVTVTPTGSGSLTATVKNLDAFGEKVNITVRSNSNAEVSASCTADYAQRITGLAVNFGAAGTVASGSSTLSVTAANVSSASRTFTPVYSPAYTLTDTFTYTQTVVPDGGLSNYLANSNDLHYNGIATDPIQANVSSSTLHLSNLQSIATSYFGVDSSEGIFVANVISEYITYNVGVPYLTYTVTATGAYTSYTKTISISATAAAATFSVTDMGLNDSVILF